MDGRKTCSQSPSGIRLLLFMIATAMILAQFRAPAAGQGPEERSPSSRRAGPAGTDISSGEAVRPPSSAPANESDKPCDLLETVAASATGEPGRGRACLAAAQCILVRRCAAPLSAELADGHDGREALTAMTTAAIALLDRAAGALKESPVEEPAGRDLRDRIDMLRAFADVFDAIARSDSSQESGKRLLTACNRLAVYLDDSNEAIVESAKLWIGVAYRRAGRPERSLQVLHPIITAPASRRVGFLARIERCRALGDTGDFAAGIALCQRLGARVDSWFAGEDAATRAKAADTVRFVRAELLRGWAGKLRASGEKDRADQALAEADKLVDPAESPPAPDRWLGVSEAIAGLSDLAAEPTSRSAVESDAGD